MKSVDIDHSASWTKLCNSHTNKLFGKKLFTRCKRPYTYRENISDFPFSAVGFSYLMYTICDRMIFQFGFLQLNRDDKWFYCVRRCVKFRLKKTKNNRHVTRYQFFCFCFFLNTFRNCRHFHMNNWNLRRAHQIRIYIYI